MAVYFQTLKVGGKEYRASESQKGKMHCIIFRYGENEVTIRDADPGEAKRRAESYIAMREGLK